MTPWNAANDFVKSRNGLPATPGTRLRAPTRRPPSTLPAPAIRRRERPAAPTSVSATPAAAAPSGCRAATRSGSHPPPTRSASRRASPASTRRSRSSGTTPPSRHARAPTPTAGPATSPSSDSDDLVWKLPATEPDDRGRVEETQAEVLATSTADGATETKSEAHDEPAAEEPQMVEEQADVSDERRSREGRPVLQA